MFSLKKEEWRDNASCVISPFYFIFMYFERLFLYMVCQSHKHERFQASGKTTLSNQGLFNKAYKLKKLPLIKQNAKFIIIPERGGKPNVRVLRRKNFPRFITTDV